MNGQRVGVCRYLPSFLFRLLPARQRTVGSSRERGVEGARANQQPELEVSGQVFLLPGSLKGKGSAARKAKEMGGEGAAK